MQSASRKFLLALLAGCSVAAICVFMDEAVMRMGGSADLRALVPALFSGLVAALIFLGIHLRYEGLYYRFSMERAVIVAEMNHHVRNAIFPLCMAVQHQAGPAGDRLVHEAIERVNIALREALTDAVTGKMAYYDKHKQKVRAA